MYVNKVRNDSMGSISYLPYRTYVLGRTYRNPQNELRHGRSRQQVVTLGTKTTFVPHSTIAHTYYT